jgi:hypothetical protein
MAKHLIKRFKISLLTFVFLLLLGLMNSNTSHASSQAQQNWSPPQRVPGYADETSPPHLLADQNHTVHAFTSQWVGQENPQLAVAYNQWSLKSGWTPVVDILLSPLGQARVGGALLDASGIIHLIFFGGDDRRADIYYTQAPAVRAGQATAWSKPVIVGPDTITPTVSKIILLQGNELVIVYSGRSQGQGLYAVYSYDLGQTWSAPEPFFLTYNPELWPTPLELYEDSNGRVHALWGLVDRTGNSLAIYYSRLDGAQEKWTSPTIFAEAIEYEADTPAIIEYNGQLIVIYHNNFPTTRWMQRSYDGGDTWTVPVRLFAHVGSNGAASLVKDSDNVLHMFFGNRIGNPAIHGMWHTTWQEETQHWREPEPVDSGPRVVGRVGGNGFDPSAARAIILQGNILLLTWVTDPGAGRNGVWYTYTKLDIPETPIKPLPSALATPIIFDQSSTPTFKPSPELQRTNLPLATEQYFLEDTNKSPNPTTALISSLIPVFLLVLTVVGFYKYRKYI